MADKDERHEEREEKREERHADHAHDREGRDETRARDEVTKVKEELAKAVEKKDLHVHETHRWMHRLNHAEYKILRDHEEDVAKDQGEPEWINDAMSAIFDADQQIVGVAKAIVEATGHHKAKDADFDKAGIADKAKTIDAALDKALGLIPANE